MMVMGQTIQVGRAVLDAYGILREDNGLQNLPLLPVPVHEA